MYLALALFLTAANIFLWIIMLSRFKKYFSTDDIIASAKEEMNLMVSDMNRNTERDLSLINDSLRQLRAATAEADRHLAVLKIEIKSQTEAVAYQKKISEISAKSKNQNPTSSKGNQASRAADRYRRTGRSDSVQDFSKTSIGSLFDDSINLSSKQDSEEPVITSPAGTQFTVEENGASYATVPVIAPSVSFADDPVVPKKDFPSQVRELSEDGKSVERIAAELGRSVAEVQMILDMGL